MDVTISLHHKYSFFIISIISKFCCFGHSERWLFEKKQKYNQRWMYHHYINCLNCFRAKKGVNGLKWIGDREIDTSLECMTKKVLVS